LAYLFIYVIIFLSGGMPYWYYHYHRPDTTRTTESDVEHAQPQTDSSFTCAWRSKLRRLSRAWKAYRVLIGVILPFTSRVASVSPPSKCSWAYIFMVLGLINGLVAFSICYLYEVDFSKPGETANRTLGEACWFCDRTLRFWVFIALPITWFFGCVLPLHCSSTVIVLTYSS
ncbi:hypothetical protein P691DRAFT_676620, partial [Macrolepiota fuliginosa MF-IS2]